MKDLTRGWVILGVMLGLLAGCAGQYDKGVRHYRPEDPATALRELRPQAEKGDPTAQFNLGSLYHQGLGVAQDYAEAVKWMRRAAEQGSSFAQTTLGTIYAEGLPGVAERDVSQALMWFIFASAQGDEEARVFRDALTLKMTPGEIEKAQKLAREFQPQDAYARAFREARAGAERGEVAAQFRLGVLYYTGQGVPVDYAAALAWFKKAADQGHPLAQYNAGHMCDKGEGTPPDYGEAARYYHLSAVQGNRLAQYILGHMYEKGRGVEIDEVQALKWYYLAAVQGETRAKTARERVTVWMNPEQIAEAQRLAREFRVVKP